MKAAILLTCFNRSEKTKACLENLFAQKLPNDLDLSVFVCDDGSTDGTSDMINNDFPYVSVVKGNGSLYWGGGMNLAWSEAKKSQDFDFYIWLNDDTFLNENAFLDFFEDYTSINKTVILSASCSKPNTEEFSYGGLSDVGPILPNGKPQKVKYINGNLVLIPREIHQAVGKISKSYTHYLGDYDYGLRAKAAGFDCYTTSEYIAECDVNEIPYWGDPNLPLAKRWEMAHSVKGLAIREYLAFKKYHHGSVVAFKTWVDTYLKIMFPSVYTKLRGGQISKSESKN
ncbi:glycosyltransferase family 2 protein [Algoriphagus namhaensis]|uniref:Glycosyltransferase family 2 protein n=1 Tax=Algoriphagus namhaensis TaxID=915353 RepID=A0ABV8ATG1_9BACT